MAEVKWTENQMNAINARSCSIAVSAAAGSGKTAVLTNRIIEQIKAGGDIKTMLVVTFTNAAAQQLKDKISDALNELLYSQSLSLSEKRHIQRQLISLPNANISTIDSFLIGLVRENFTEAGIPIGSGIMDETVRSQLESDVAELLIQDYYEGKITDEDRKIEDFDTFVNTFGNPLSTEPLIENIIAIKEYYDTQPDQYKSMLEGLDNCNFQESAFGRILFNYTRSGMVHYKNILEQVQNMFEVEGDQDEKTEIFKNAKEFCDSVIDAIDSKEDIYDNVKNLLLSYTSDSLRKGKKTPDYLKYYAGYKNEFKKFVDELLDKYYCFDSESVEDTKNKTNIQIKNLIAFLKEFEDRLYKQKSLKRMFSFNDYERLALKILTESDLVTPSVLCARLKSNFSEIYIDEYQDTNSLQDRLFRLLSRDNNLFTVGDIKQSIYGFRGAEPSIFDEQIKSRPDYNPLSHEPQTRIYLSDNFRSTQQIIDAVNSVFDTVLKTDPIISYGASDRLRCGNKTVGPKPELHIFYDGSKEYDLKGIELKYIAKRIVEEIAKDSDLNYSDFAVLTRNNKTSSLVADVLNGMDIPCVDRNAFQFFNNPEIMLVIALLKLIDNPYSDLYMTSVMKSPLYGFTLEDQIRFRMEHSEKPLYVAVKNCSETNDQWSKRCKKLISDMERYKPLSRVLSCSEFVKEIYDGMMLTSIVSVSEGDEREDAARANLMQLYEYARSFDNRNDKSLYDFLEYIDQLIKNDEKIDVSSFNSSDNAVQITTIHSSKGLQYKYVFMPCLDAGGHNGNNQSIIMSRMLPLSFKLVENDQIVDNLFFKVSKLNNSMAESDEMMRVLYVGLTRPETNLIMIASSKSELEKVQEQFDINSNVCHASFEANNMSYYSRLKTHSILDILIDGFSLSPDVVSLSITPASDVAKGITEIKENNKEKVEERSDDEELTKTFKERFDFKYPYEHLNRIPNKLSVSKMFPELLDQPEEGYSPEQLEIEEKDDRKRTEIVPQFISESTDISPREQGIAVHMFMQFFDLDNVYKNGVEEEIKRLHDMKYIYDETYDIISKPWNKKKIENFFKSSLAMDMKEAKTIIREKKFTLNFPASSFTKDEEKAETIKDVPLLVQGVIDCLYINNKDELILVDYKTDHFSKTVDRETIEKTLKERYNNQLMYYAYASEKIMKKEVAHVRLYSFAIDDIIELERKDIL